MNAENDSVDMGITTPTPETKGEATPSEPGSARSETQTGLSQTSASPVTPAPVKQPVPALTKEPEENQKIATPLPENCSQANAVVQMNHISLSDDISAQLEAIQAAANAVLAGDSTAVEGLGNFQTQTEAQTKPQEKESENTNTAENESTESLSLRDSLRNHYWAEPEGTENPLSH
ncbi:MAG: hypothetical protein ACPG5T_02235 [Endozoicomonas sp.]